MGSQLPLCYSPLSYVESFQIELILQEKGFNCEKDIKRQWVIFKTQSDVISPVKTTAGRHEQYFYLVL